MPFAFSQVKPMNTGRVSSMDVPLGEYLSNAFTQGVHDSMFSSIMRWREQSLEREGPWITAEEANEKYGLPTLKFDRNIYESEARLLNERKQAELRRAFYLDMGAPGGLFSKRGLAGLGAGFIGSILNPLDFSVNFLPIVGSEAAAIKAGALGRGAFRQSLNRGMLITEEALARAVPAPRLVSSMVQGSVGSLVAEIPHLVSALESKENYGVEDSFVNVIAGGVLSGALHLGVTQAIRIFERLHPASREAMLRQGIDQFVRGQEINVTKFVDIDEVTIRESVKFDEQVARASAAQAIDIKDIQAAVKAKYGEKPVKAAFKLTDGRILTGDAHWLIDTTELKDPDWNGLQEGFLTDKGRFVSRDEAALLVGITDTKYGLISEQLTDTSDSDFLLDEDDRSVFHALTDIGATDAEATREVRRIRQVRADEAFFSRPDIQEKIQQETEARTQALMNEERAKYDEDGKFIAERDKEIRRQIDEGRVLTPEQVKQWKWSEADKEAATTTIKEQNQALMEELKALEEELGAGEAEAEVKGDVEKELLDRVEELLNSLKIKGGNVQEGITGMPIWLWNGAVDAVIAAVRAGKKIGEAIEAGVTHLRSSQGLGTSQINRMVKLVLDQHNAIKKNTWKGTKFELNDEFSKILGKKITDEESFRLRGALFYLPEDERTLQGLIKSVRQIIQDDLDEASGGMFVTDGEGSLFKLDDKGDIVRNPEFKQNVDEIEGGWDIVESGASLLKHLRSLEEKDLGDFKLTPKVEQQFRERIQKQLQSKRESVPDEVSRAAADWGKAEKAYRRALRQGPDIVDEARIARDDAEVTFRGLAEKYNIPEAEFTALKQQATQTSTPGVSRRKFIDIIGKVTGMGVTTPMGVIKAVGEGALKTGVETAVKKSLMPNLTLKQLFDLAQETLSNEAGRDITKVVRPEHLEGIEDPLAAWAEQVVPTRPDHPLAALTESDIYDHDFMPPILEQLLRESPKFKKAITEITDADAELIGFAGPTDRENAAMWQIQYPTDVPTKSLNELPKLLSLMQDTPLSDLEAKGDISPKMLEQLNAMISSVASLYPEIRSAIDLAAGKAEADIVKTALTERVKSEADAIEQALKCLIINI